ncbi:hypothetical protein [Virgibacillus oceani]|uniref:Uncharacterized protein n=1 Tax=Virgibacillus oceani TaxID=1479511 RepID=A0A917HQD1_9BACI|nr:hypothetical protein [Virgibacillus oceani]GGG86023.1 hypothetical protein GCM10011398_34730 [Virgibacillus oceani]
MKRKLLIKFGAPILALSLVAACGNNDNGDPVEDDEAPLNQEDNGDQDLNDDQGGDLQDDNGDLNGDQNGDMNGDMNGDNGNGNGNNNDNNNNDDLLKDDNKNQ